MPSSGPPASTRTTAGSPTSAPTHPARHTGVALVDLEDVHGAVDEIRWAKDAGLRGGILLPASTGELAPYNHPRYEPIWQVCAELEQPVNVHSGDSPAYDLDLPGSMGIFMTEVLWFAHRPLWYLLWAGVFERHPTLKFALVEQGATWVPDVLETMDAIHGMEHFTYLRDDLPLPPSDYWHRQCFVNGGLGDRRVHEQVGVDNLMWGSDYPHFEGTWPHSKDRIAAGIVGMPREDVDKVLGGNAAASTASMWTHSPRSPRRSVRNSPEHAGSRYADGITSTSLRPLR